MEEMLAEWSTPAYSKSPGLVAALLLSRGIFAYQLNRAQLTWVIVNLVVAMYRIDILMLRDVIEGFVGLSKW